MDKTSFLHEAQQRLSELLRSSPAADIERNVKAFMAQTFQRMDLITRDEFELFEARLNHLQTRIAELEARLGSESTSATSPNPDTSV
ncbi:MAG: accessory factor UbiK family protein [Burkholderiales bacterium]|jgi:BMFP domain-containing protein YqiC